MASSRGGKDVWTAEVVSVVRGVGLGMALVKLLGVAGIARTEVAPVTRSSLGGVVDVADSIATVGVSSTEGAIKEIAELFETGVGTKGLAFNGD